MCDCGCHGKHTLGPINECVQLAHAHHVEGYLFPTKRHDGTPLDKFRAKVSKLPLHFTAVLLQARGDWHVCNAFVGFPAWNLRATLLVVQGQPGWEDLRSRMCTICTMEES